MEITQKDVKTLEKALYQLLIKYGNIHKDFSDLGLLNVYGKDLEQKIQDTVSLHGKVCNLIGEIERELEYKKKYPEVNQALNEIITIQRDKKWNLE